MTKIILSDIWMAIYTFSKTHLHAFSHGLWRKGMVLGRIDSKKVDLYEVRSTCFQIPALIIHQLCDLGQLFNLSVPGKRGNEVAPVS